MKRIYNEYSYDLFAYRGFEVYEKKGVLTKRLIAKCYTNLLKIHELDSKDWLLEYAKEFEDQGGSEVTICIYY